MEWVNCECGRDVPLHTVGEAYYTTCHLVHIVGLPPTTLVANGTLWISSCFRLNPNFQIFVMLFPDFSLESYKHGEIWTFC